LHRPGLFPSRGTCIQAYRPSTRVNLVSTTSENETLVNYVLFFATYRYQKRIGLYWMNGSRGQQRIGPQNPRPLPDSLRLWSQLPVHRQMIWRQIMKRNRKKLPIQWRQYRSCKSFLHVIYTLFYTSFTRDTQICYRADSLTE